MSTRLRYAMVAVCIACARSVAHGDVVPDDHGNSVWTATVLSGASNTLTGTLEYDTDTDVFSFPFKPWTSYTLAVETGTVLGVRIEVVPPAGDVAMWQTNSVWEDRAALEEAYHEGASSRWHVKVSPLFLFTTGTYHLAVWENPGQDPLGKGFPDAWQLHYFGNLDTADPELHGDAFRTGRAPDDPLAVDSLQVVPAGDVVGWTLAAHGTYDLYASTNLLTDSDWPFLDTFVAGSAGGLIQWTNLTSGASTRFYRIRFRDEL